MITLPTGERETHRVEMVRSFGLLDQQRATQHDEIAALARDLADTQWGLVTLVDAERVWFSGAANMSGEQHCRWTSFCTHTIADPDQITWISDTRDDFRVSRLPSVVEAPHILFYGGAPIVVNGHAVGSVCVFDDQPRPYDPALARSLTRLASIVSEDLAARHREKALRTALLASADALIQCNDHGVITEWSEGAAALFGFSQAEAPGRNIDIIVPEAHKANHNRAFERWRLGGGARVGTRLELRACRKDGSEVDIELWMSVAHLHGVPHIHANIRDISGRTAQAAALRDASAAAEAANQAKTLFLTNMTHELRTPLNGVIGVVDLLSATALSAHQTELVSIIKDSSDHLQQVIGSVLDIARIEAGEMTIEQVPLVLPDLIDSVAADARLAADRKGIAFSMELSPDLPTQVTGDPMRLRQVLASLLSNAVKFTEAGSVTLRATRAASACRFEVTDTGIGFTPDQRLTIFGRFQQADPSINRRFGGSGLGLALCAELTGAMGGTLDCHSGPGLGSTFWFEVDLPAVCALPGDDTSQRDPAPAMRVLVVDDNPTNRRVAELMLLTLGADVACAQDGDEAVDAFLTGRFDLILMDMMMPVLDGPAATRAIRSIERSHGRPHTPIFMLTANNLPHHIETSLQAGADLHLAKPITPAALFDAIGKIDNADDVSITGTGS